MKKIYGNLGKKRTDEQKLKLKNRIPCKKNLLK